MSVWKEARGKERGGKWHLNDRFTARRQASNTNKQRVSLCVCVRARACASLIYEEDVILVKSNVNYSAY